MSRYRISVDAQEDMDGILEYTVTAWGWRQSVQYLSKLEDCFDLLANSPSIGRSCDSIRAGLRRFEIGRHVVLYVSDSDGVLVLRVLYQRVMPDNYFR